MLCALFTAVRAVVCSVVVWWPTGGNLGICTYRTLVPPQLSSLNRSHSGPAGEAGRAARSNNDLMYRSHLAEGQLTSLTVSVSVSTVCRECSANNQTAYTRHRKQAEQV